jgi:hypothetical protein
MKFLVSGSENLRWDLFDFNMVRFCVERDGSCCFHALAKAYFKPYILGRTEEGIFDRRKFVRDLRKELAKTLGAKINPEDENSPTYYSQLANGELENISRELPEYSLENMQKELSDMTNPISNIYNEFISDQLNLDIYILDANKKDVYMTGTDDKLLYKGRKSVVLLYLPGHYELIGISKDNKIETYFSPDSPFILRIRERMFALREI